MGFLNSLKNATVGTVSHYDALPKDGVIEINPAYVMTLIISSESAVGSGFKNSSFSNRLYNGKTIIKAYCPDRLKLNFSNEFGTIDPMALAASDLVNGGVQLFTGTSTKHRINNIRVWKGSKPLSMQVKFELYATKSSTKNNILTGDTEMQTGGLSSNDLIFLIQQLTSLAQPVIDDNTGRLIPPGPSPLVVDFKGHAFKVTKDKETGKVLKTELVTDKNHDAQKVKQSTRTGTRVDLRFGDFFTMSHVIVKSVDVDIPYVMASSAKYIGNEKKGITALNNTDRAKPVMATVTMSIETKTMVDQEMFSKMINNIEQPNPAEIDLTKLTGDKLTELFGSMFQGALTMASDYVGTSAKIEETVDTKAPKLTK